MDTVFLLTGSERSAEVMVLNLSKLNFTKGDLQDKSKNVREIIKDKLTKFTYGRVCARML